MKRSTKIGAGLLVDLVLDRVGAHRDLDDDVAVVRDVLAGGDAVEAHGGGLRAEFGEVIGGKARRTPIIPACRPVPRAYHRPAVPGPLSAPPVSLHAARSPARHAVHASKVAASNCAAGITTSRPRPSSIGSGDPRGLVVGLVRRRRPRRQRADHHRAAQQRPGRHGAAHRRRHPADAGRGRHRRPPGDAARLHGRRRIAGRHQGGRAQPRGDRPRMPDRRRTP